MKPNPLPTFCVTLTLLLGLVCTVSANPKAASWRGQSVVEFSAAENDALQWRIVNDGVMGGLSEGNVEFTAAETMKFSGNLSLENNGGFSTVRSGEVNLNLSNDLGLLMLVRGDGRTYEARIDSDSKFRGNPVSFSGKFTTTKGEWQQVKIPFSAFKGSFRGTDLPDMKLNPAVVERLWILLADKKSGAFELEVDWIRTYGKGKGNFTGRKARPTPGENAPATANDPKPQLIATAVADGRFNTLKAALDAAGLTPFFQWDNPLTVFAPTDEAFAKLPKGVLDDLLKPENKDKLVAVLSYHVSAGSNDLAKALQEKQVKTVEGSSLKITFSDGRVRINNAVLVDGNIQCADGLIHVVDTVLLPPETEAPKKTVLSVAQQAGSFSTLLAAVKTAELRGVLDGDGPFTVLAPTDEAFAALPDGVVASLLKKENQPQLVDILKYHVVSGRISVGDALNAGEANSVQGEAIQFSIENGALKANGSTIQTAGVEGGNGIIHIIDTVLLPPTMAKKLNAGSCNDCPTSDPKQTATKADEGSLATK